MARIEEHKHSKRRKTPVNNEDCRIYVHSRRDGINSHNQGRIKFQFSLHTYYRLAHYD